MNKPILEFVSSAPTWGIYPNVLLSKVPKEQIKEAINAYASIMHKRIIDNCKNFVPIQSLMYNAFVEKNKLQYFKYYGHCGFKNIYSDSGGLQILTRGHEITEELKKDIYKTQMYSDYGLCFDVIKVSRLTNDHHRNERSQGGNKIFHQDEHKEAGYLTGQNIKEQIEFFQKHEAKTKVIIIVQGNTRDDMMVFFDEIQKQLTEEHYKHIGGFAVADTCMGIGTIELVEMLKVAKEISCNSHKSIGSHLHLLGVGSYLRLVPTILLKKSGFLDTIDYISYDSSKISQTFTIGQVIVDDRVIRLGLYRNKKSEGHFINVYNMFSEFLQSKGFSQDDYLGMLFGDNSYSWSSARVYQNARLTNDNTRIALSYLYRAAHSFYQTATFNETIDKMLVGKFKLGNKYLYLQMLEHMHSEDDLNGWLNHQKQTKKTRSKRIRREDEVGSLEDLFQ